MTATAHNTHGYIGRVVTHIADKGFAFIGIASVIRDNGEAHGLATTDDIFVHMDDCAAPLKVGLELAFKVIPNATRGNGHLRASGAIEHVTPELLPATGDAVPGFRFSLVPAGKDGAITTAARVRAHAGMKTVAADVVAQVEKNAPLKDLPRDEEEFVLPDDPGAILQMLSGYLFQMYPGLHAIDMDYRVVDFDAEALDRMVATEAAALRDDGMDLQAARLEREYAGFKETRRMLAWIWEQKLLQPGTRLSPSVLSTYVKMIETIKAATGKAETINDIIAVSTFMTDRGLLRPNTVIPMTNLPDLFMAVPVWFFRFADGKDTQVSDAQWTNEDPEVSASAKYFCDLVDGQNWTDTFLIFNRRLRTVKLYEGDIIPPHITRVMREASAVFDYVVIMTPYHDVAGREWQDEKWLRAIDPYVVGFKKGLPTFFLLGRFSDTGLFPLHSELVADTVGYLRANKDNLMAFNPDTNGGKLRSYPYWLWRDDNSCLAANTDLVGTHLVRRTEQLLAAFDAGNLFDWLRGKETATTPAVSR